MDNQINNNHLVEITNFFDHALDIFAREREKELLNNALCDYGIFIAESPKVVARALDAGYQPISLLMEKKHIYGEGCEIIKRCPGIPVYYGEFDLLTGITGYELTRGLLCAMRRKPNASIEKICESYKKIAILDEVQNPTNVGAIIRSAAALGIDAVLLSPGCSDPLYRRAIRVSMGTVFSIPWAYIGDSIDEWKNSGIEILKSFGYCTLAMALGEGTVPISSMHMDNIRKTAIILGAEGEGISEEILEKCDARVHIPMYRGVDSLNVAAASAVAFYEFMIK